MKFITTFASENYQLNELIILAKHGLFRNVYDIHFRQYTNHTYNYLSSIFRDEEW